MTVLYIDVSHHDWNRRGGQLDWAKIRAATSPVMVARATYGDPSGWNRPSYHHGDLHRGAKAAGFDVRGSYANFIRGDSASIARQVDWLRREMDAVGAVWAMADIERYPEMMTAGVFPRWSDVQRLNDRWHSVEDRVMAWYLPEWVWERSDMGRPDLRELHGPLVSSRYPLSYTADDPAGLYGRCGGDDGKGWNVYEYNGTSGHVRPLLWQFTSSALVPGTTDGADCNAFRGTLTELRALLHPTNPANEEDDMPLTEADMPIIRAALHSTQIGRTGVTFGQVMDTMRGVPDKLTALGAAMTQLGVKDFTDEASIVSGVLAGLGQRSAADILAALTAAGVDLDALRAELERTTTTTAGS